MKFFLWNTDKQDYDEVTPDKKFSFQNYIIVMVFQNDVYMKKPKSE